jgi:hypothetical protein
VQEEEAHHGIQPRRRTKEVTRGPTTVHGPTIVLSHDVGRRRKHSTSVHTRGVAPGLAERARQRGGLAEVGTTLGGDHGLAELVQVAGSSKAA